jgi:hypothetical protein
MDTSLDQLIGSQQERFRDRQVRRSQGRIEDIELAGISQGWWNDILQRVCH